MKKDCVRFKQSLHDFPLEVLLDKKVPSWDLSRWRNQSLRFVPTCDEGFSLHGNKQQLLYRGRKQSHRFTILSDGAFEYDCILLREPDSNIISLRMEGAENYDFFRQPDFVRDEFLKGSYAVYKKETLVGEGTGKLCHIHRPKIFDARGFSCWGDLEVAGDELLIIIPEGFLSEAKYPVVVDPTVGTVTIGSQITGTDPNNPYYDRPWLDNEYAINKYIVPQNGRGLCTAYVYAYHEDTYDNLTPCLYTNQNNKPYMLKSQNEKDINVNVWNSPAGWRNNTFELVGDILAGESIWFGVYSGYFTTRFDYGGECYKGWFNYDNYPDYEGWAPPYIELTDYQPFCNIKWSWYFNYTTFSAQNYIRTITQGMKLTDTRKVTASYKRNLSQTVRANTIINRINAIVRKCVMTVRNTMSLQRFTTFYRKAIEAIKISSTHSFMRSLVRKCIDNLSVRFGMNRTQGFLRAVQEKVKSFDSRSYPLLIIRNVDDRNLIYEVTQRKAEYIKQIEIQANTSGETLHRAEYYRMNNDDVQADGLALRNLLMVVKIISRLFVRDYFFFRFLKAKEELKLKSSVTRELLLDSKIV
ncbi:MAG: hypothetical protein LBV20_04400 [Treponema sp.]|jgi:hypothetical protein|nr:hypothetical protein [Treponema sp.]